jgi:hypothetical protein
VTPPPGHPEWAAWRSWLADGWAIGPWVFAAGLLRASVALLRWRPLPVAIVRGHRQLLLPPMPPSWPTTEERLLLIALTPPAPRRHRGPTPGRR